MMLRYRFKKFQKHNRLTRFKKNLLNRFEFLEAKIDLLSRGKQEQITSSTTSTNDICYANRFEEIKEQVNLFYLKQSLVKRGFDNHSQLLEEYYKFLYLMSLKKDSYVIMSPSPLIDEVWHLHMLYPSDYKDHSLVLTSNQFIIQHNPDGEFDPDHVRFAKRQNLVNLYRTTFKQEPPISVWRQDQYKNKTTPQSSSSTSSTNNNELTLYIKGICNSKIWEITCSSNESILDIKKKVGHITNYPVEQIRLIFYGKQLVDDKTVNDYNIQTLSTIHLTLSLKGC